MFVKVGEFSPQRTFSLTPAFASPCDLAPAHGGCHTDCIERSSRSSSRRFSRFTERKERRSLPLGRLRLQQRRMGCQGPRAHKGRAGRSRGNRGCARMSRGYCVCSDASLRYASLWLCFSTKQSTAACPYCSSRPSSPRRRHRCSSSRPPLGTFGCAGLAPWRCCAAWWRFLQCRSFQWTCPIVPTKADEKSKKRGSALVERSLLLLCAALRR